MSRCCFHREGLTVEEALDICGKCMAEIKERFLVDTGEYTIKIVDKDGGGVIN
eukprot:SAG11_NODE_29829_length_306_cov_2.376812_1_plen_52_part_01